MFRSFRKWYRQAMGSAADPPVKLIFISYRRTDSAYVASQLARQLEEEFGKRVFIDHTSIPPGVEFPTHIDDAVRAAKVVLVLIGKDWQNCRDAAGRLRLDHPDDLHRKEIELAYQLSGEQSVQASGTKVRIVPVFLEGGDFDSSDSQLPSSLDFLRRLNGVKLRSDARDYFNDLAVLKEHLRQCGVPCQDREPWRVRIFWMTVYGIIGIILAIVLVVGSRMFLKDPVPPVPPFDQSKHASKVDQVHVPFLGHVMEDDRTRIEGATEETIVWIAKTSDDVKLQELAKEYENDPKALLILLRKSLNP